jgi:5-oxopent-3-ene-1,2,5-tricarboxylate decarboxylase/2-hydroxyhepta-2,4-diene-1,7-dioate isomerase
VFLPHDYVLHVTGEPLARDVRAGDANNLLASGVGCLPPVVGTVFGTLLNDADSLAALGNAVHEAPYKAPPKAPILYVKPRNSIVGHRSAVEVPAEGAQLGASLGIVIGRVACRVSEADALKYVAGYVTVADLSVPHENVYRPSVRFRARDGFCVIGPCAVAKKFVANPDSLAISVEVNGERVFRADTSTALRGVARLLSDVTEFMTLSSGDVLTLGVPHGAPVAYANDSVRIAIGDLPPLEFSLVAQKGIQ